LELHKTNPDPYSNPNHQTFEVKNGTLVTPTIGNIHNNIGLLNLFVVELEVHRSQYTIKRHCA